MSALSTFSGNLIPSKWAKKMAAVYHTSLVMNYIANTDYEGEIKDSGDVVKVRIVPTIDVGDYVIGTDMTVQSLTGSSVDVNIDKAKYFAFNADDIETKQADVDYVSKSMEEGAYAIKKQVETAFFSGIYTGADTDNTGATAGAASGIYNLGASGSAVALTKTNVLDYIFNCATVLDEQDVPDADRWIVIPPAMANIVKKSDIREVYVTGDTKSVIRTGNIGMIDRFNVFVSNVLPNANGVFIPIFGHKSAVTFASQLVKTEMVTRERQFGKVCRGLSVFGFGVIKPEGIGCGHVTISGSVSEDSSGGSSGDSSGGSSADSPGDTPAVTPEE